MATEQPQHLTALELANRTRFARAEARRELQGNTDRRASRRALADLLERMPEWLEGAPIGTVLRWAHGMADHAAQRAVLSMRHPSGHGFAPTEQTHVGDLTLRQLEALEAWLRR